MDKPNTFVDTVILAIIDDALHVLLVKRDQEPFCDHWALVGGFVDVSKDSSLDETAKRKLENKTGFKTPYLEQYATVGNENRDPRGWSITTVYFALIPESCIDLKIGEGVREVKWTPIQGSAVDKKLAFDHAELLTGCLNRIRNKALYTSLPVYLLEDKFTLSELQHAYEIILNKSLERKAFRRRMLNSGIIAETGELSHGGSRPAKIFQLIKDEKDAYFFGRNLGG